MRSREVGGQPRHSLIAALFLACAIVLGGGGSPNPGIELLLQVAFVAAALAWLWVPASHGSVPLPRARSFWLIAALVLALPLAQLVPLPPDIWTNLGGRQADRAAALALVGREASWQPLSLSPARTLAAVLAIIPALFAFFATASLGARGRARIAGTIAAMTVVAAMYGALQLSLGATSPHLYLESHPTLTGFQANRNAAADVFLIGIAAAAAFLAPSLYARDSHQPGSQGPVLLADRRTAAIILAVVVAVLFFATVLTGSRTGIVLLLPVMVGVWVILFPALADLGRTRQLPALAVFAAIPFAALAVWQSGNSALASVARRFVLDEDGRREMWRDAWFAMTQAWPFGVGLGGAQPAMISAERLEVLDPLLPNRVHNDYLELALEGGLAAMLLLAVIALVLAVAAWRSWRERPSDRHLTVLGIVILLVAAAHSVVDYPLRSMALACLIGTGAGLLMSMPRPRETNEPSA
jgi:O-antigen ligase